MKINIRHIENTFNYGSCMMAINLISSIANQVNDVSFYTDCSTDEDLQRLKRETGVDSIYRYNIESSDNLIIKVINKIRRTYLNYKANKIENVIVIGGDDISEYYTIERLVEELSRIKAESKRKNMILLGQTMGPFTGERKEMAREFLKDTIIFTRDHDNYNYLKDINFCNVTEGKDLAFLALPMQSKSTESVMKKYNLISESYVTVVLSGLVSSYTSNIKCYIDSQVKIIRNIINNSRLADKKIILLAHVLKPAHADDRVVISKVLEALNDEEKKRIVIVTEKLLPSEARGILGNGLFTITGRMHAAVSTFFMRKPAISISYSIKYLGVIGHGLDMNDLIIEAADEKLWSTYEVCDLVEEKVNFVLDNYNKLLDKIDKRVFEASSVLKEELNEVIYKLK